jgi:nitrile hydratase
MAKSLPRPSKGGQADGVDGMHDLGGRAGFGAVVVEPDEPPFHEEWEGRVFALGAAMMTPGLYGTPEFRHAVERMRPAHYLAASYYERWLTAIATLLVEKGTVARDELDEAVGATFPLSGPLRVAPASTVGPDVTEARFRVGDEVVVRNLHPLGHTRCPGYVRGHHGVIVRYDGPCNFDDVEAHAGTKRVEPLYCVVFDSTELWGDDAEANTIVAVDLFEFYLEAR